MEIRINAVWDSSLEAEVKALLKSEINPALEKANAAVGEEMRGALVRHLEKDVYPQSIYKPRMYERREYDGGLVGQAADPSSTKVFTDSTRATIQFKPSGEHPTVAGWHKVDADDLIGRIEKHYPEYNWLPRKGKKIPNRPFWQNFVDEMVDGGRIESVFQIELRSALPDGWELDISDGVTRDSQDGEYG